MRQPGSERYHTGCVSAQRECLGWRQISLSTKEVEEALLRLNEHVTHIGQEAKQGRGLGPHEHTGASPTGEWNHYPSNPALEGEQLFMSLSIQRRFSPGSQRADQIQLGSEHSFSSINEPPNVPHRFF
jgi:hypothetical protein